MKKSILTFTIIVLNLVAQAQSPKLAVISFDANDKILKTNELTELLRIEISKHNKYEMIDRYEIAESLNAADITSTTCFSKTCLIKAGEELGVAFSVSGSADKIGDALFIRLRMLNLKTKAIEKEVDIFETKRADHTGLDEEMEGFAEDLAITANVAMLKFKRGDYI